MKKIISIEQAHSLDTKANQKGIPTDELMERAAKKIAEAVIHFVSEKKLAKIAYIFCGKGNNGGDGYATGRYLIEAGFDVRAYPVLQPDETSLCNTQKTRFKNAHGIILPEFPYTASEGVILDAIFGIGFQGVPDEKTGDLIDKINRLPLFRFAIDIPSGLHGNMGHVADGKVSPCIKADRTLAIECAKIGFFVGNGWNYVGDIQTLPIGLDQSELASELAFLEEEDVAPLIKRPTRNCHKYERGHVVGLAGSHGMTGAAILASSAALKAGAGIVHLLHPSSLTQELAGPPWEVVRLAYPEHQLPFVRSWLARAKARFVGPGLGVSKESEFILKMLWDDYKHFSILDADCLNFLARNQIQIGPLPNSILTPHIGEMRRLLGEQTADPVSFAFLKRCQLFCEKNLTNVVLKGGPSFLFSPGKPITVMPRGTPGMATAGAGDVLTGILAALLSQGVSAQETVCLGTYLHGLAGEYAENEETVFCMTASSIISHLPSAFKHLQKA